MSTGEPSNDLAAIVEYGQGKWLVDQSPWALWACLAGLAVIVYAGGLDGKAAALGVVYLSLLALAFVGWVVTTAIEDRSDLSVFATLPIGILIFILVAAVITVVAGRTGDVHGHGGALWGSLVDPPFPVFGWMLVYGGVGWIAYAVFRHLRPGRPVVSLSPLGISLHRPWLRNVFIPWRDVEGVGPVQIENSAGGRPRTIPNVIAVSVTRDVHERSILSKLSRFAPPDFEFMFRPNGEKIQLVLTSPDLAVAPKDFLVPVEARWRAFRERSGTAPVQEGPLVAYGRWAGDIAAWRSALCLVAIAGMLAIVLHAGLTRTG